MKSNPFSRAWYYFRNGWATYFSFVFAIANTLITTYYLAIKDYPAVKEIFPTFTSYVVLVTIIGIPILIFVGYVHYKKTSAYQSEAAIIYESNPYVRRVLINTEIILSLNLQLLDKIAKLSANEKLSEEERQEISKLTKELSEFTEKRSFENDVDLEYLKFVGKAKPK